MEEPNIGAEFSICLGEQSEMSTNATFPLVEKMDEKNYSVKEEKVGSVSASASPSINLEPSSTQRDENTSKMEESINTSSIEVGKGRKTSARSKIHRMKRKVKVDWTTELHKQFVQAVEQLGVDKAVPSKILELMGIDCLTRHNVASHLQKYRSHRKHLLAREAEAASWNRRRRTYGRTGKKDLSSCVPATGFPPVTQMPHFKPLNVWGHPWTNQSWMYGWSEPSLLPDDPSYWYYYYHHQYVPVPGMPFVLPHFPAAAFPGQPVPGIPSNSMYRVEPGVGISTGLSLSAQPLTQPPCAFQLSKECIDTAVGDVLSKPWLPLPLGLKPPSMDSVMAELQRQGISKIQPDFG